MKKVILIILLISMIFPTTICSKENPSSYYSGKIHGICIRGEDLSKEGPENLLKKLKRMGYNAVFLLSKTPEGEVFFKSDKFPFKVDIIGKAIKSSKEIDIKFYAYFPVVMDKNYASKHPSEKMIDIGNASNTYYVSLISENYIDYLKSFISELLAFDVDGIVFDYVRFPSGSYDFSSSFLEMAKEKGIDVGKVKDIAYSTFVKPADWKTMFEAFEERDSNIIKWSNLREEVVSNLVFILSDYARSIRHGISIGAFMVSRGFRNPLIKDAKKISETWAYQIVNFAQEPVLFKGKLDFLAPMVYLSGLNESPDYTKFVITGIKEYLGADFPVFVAINPDSITIEDTQDELFYSYEGGEGVVLFRYPLFKMALMEAFTPSCDSEITTELVFESSSKEVTFEISCSSFIPIFENNVIISPFYSYHFVELSIGEKVLYINNTRHEMDVAPFIIDSRSFVPVRFVSEALNEKVSWDAKNKEVVISGSNLIKLKIGNKNFVVNGVERNMDVAPFIIDSRTFVPVRFISEALGMDVQWNGNLRKVTIKGFKRID